MNLRRIEVMAKNLFKPLLIFLLLSTSLQAENLKVLSWNVFLLPSTAFHLFKTSPAKRAELLAKKLKSEKVDVIAFQEVFLRKGYKNIHKELKKIFLYSTGKPAKSGTIANSGLVVYSLYPILSHEMKFFGNCAWITADCFSSKGFLKITIKKNDELVSIYNTHIQAGKSEEAREARFEQLYMIKNDLDADENLKVLAGDFNIDKYSLNNNDYKQMLAILDVVDDELQGEQYTVDHCRNTLKKCKDENVTEQLDYIFVQGKGESFDTYKVRRYMEEFKRGPFRKKEINDLSDHFAVYGEVNF